MFGVNVKLPAYVALHQLETRNQVPDDMKDFINKYRSAGNCTSPCKDPVGKEEALTMADYGEPAAAIWCKFNRWLPLTWTAASAHSARAAASRLQPSGHALDQRAFANIILIDRSVV